jgi:SAM-dependent methyltransferase
MAAYQDTLVSPMFEPWGAYLLDRLELSAGERVLDVATGPGTVARLAAARVGPGGSVVAADISPAMLAIAEAKGVVASGTSIEYLLSPAAPLSVADDSFDVACCQQGLQFFPDREGALAEMHRALRPSGRLGLAVWCSAEDCPPFAAMRDAVGEVLGPDAAARYAGGPWGLHAPQLLRDLVAGAGFTDVSVTEVARPVTFAGGAAQLERSLPASGLAAEVAALDHGTRAALSTAIAARLQGQTDDTGAVTSFLTSQIVLATAG